MSATNLPGLHFHAENECLDSPKTDTVFMSSQLLHAEENRRSASLIFKAFSAALFNAILRESMYFSESPAHPFLVGVAISVYQNSGGPGTNWEAFEDQKTLFGQPVIKDGARCGKSCDFWNHYEADIAKVAGLNANAFRLSLEWSRIEPHRGQIDREAVQHYHKIFDCIQKHKLEPNVTLHHFARPLWFDKLGGFEKSENIPFFTDFVETAFREFGKRSKLWSTFNEINVEAFCGYIYGQFPPAKMVNFSLAGRVFVNMLTAHKEAYKLIKSLPGGKQAQVGIVHNFLQYTPRSPDGWSSYYISPVCKLMGKIWSNEALVEYFTKGVFNWDPPFGKSIQLVEDEKPGCDFIGINYYGRVVLDWKFATICFPGEKMTDMPFPLYAPGLYRACEVMSRVGVPLYITETGVPDAKDVLRTEMFTSYFGEIERVLKDGIDLRGVFYWTLTDNWEWAQGWGEKFGLYRWSPGDGHKRTEVASTKNLAKIYADFPERLRTLKKMERQLQ